MVGLSPLSRTYIVTADTGPIEESLKAPFTDEGAVEVVIVAGVPRAAVELRTPYVLATEHDAAKSITANSSEPSLMRELRREVFIVPFPCNGVGATPLHTESRDTHGMVGEVLKESWVHIDRGDDVIFEEEDPWGLAERGKILVDFCTGCGHLSWDGSARKICKTLKADGKRNVRVLFVIAV